MTQKKPMLEYEAVAKTRRSKYRLVVLAIALALLLLLVLRYLVWASELQKLSTF